MEYLDGIKPVGYVAGIAMAKQNYTPGSLTGNEPTRELYAICGFKCDVLEGKPDVAWVG